MADKPILAVFGATGHQGGAIISHYLSQPDPPYHIRALTRNPSSPTATALSNAGATIVRADLNDTASLSAALKGAHAVYLVTDFWSAPDATGANETAQAKRVLDVLASSDTLTHLVFSSLPSLRELSGGTYAGVVHFEGKAEAVAWLRDTHAGLWEKTTVLWVGTYMQLWKHFPAFAPVKKVGRGSGGEEWVLESVFYDRTVMPLVDVRDTGKAVSAILRQGKAVMGRTVGLVSTERVSVEEQLRVWGEMLGRKVSFRHIGEEESLEKIKALGVDEYLVRDLWETGLVFREYEGRLLHGEAVLQVSEILPDDERLTTWDEYVGTEDWGAFLEG